MRRTLLACLLVVLGCLGTAPAQVQFRQLKKDVIQTRLQDFSQDNRERETTLKKLFAESGCQNDHLSEQPVRKLPPNLICILPGKTNDVIVVGAHTDHVWRGTGVVDNWSGASLLPSLYYSLSAQPRQHTYIFIGFTGEEEGMVGSDFYVRHLTAEQRDKTKAMVNMDTLGLGPTKVWASHADKELLRALAIVAHALKLPVDGVNVEKVGSTDSESFAHQKIPSITIHSLTQETLPILHNPRDRLSAMKMDDYYSSYVLIAGYLAYLDNTLGQQAPPKSNAP
jgi:Peptidase family M28